jgi:hypothetical protein
MLTFWSGFKFNNAFTFYYIPYLFGGLGLVGYFGLLRGRGPSSSSFLRVKQLFLFSLFWFPVRKLEGLLSYCWIPLLWYLPIYVDLSEHHFGWSKDSLSSKFVCYPLQRFLRKFFTPKLIKTSPIENQSIFGLHPHGILPLGAIVNVALDQDFPLLFPKLERRVVLAASSCFLVSLSMLWDPEEWLYPQFPLLLHQVPGYREILISNNVHDCSRFNAEKWLERGFSVGIVPGGAREGT